MADYSNWKKYYKNAAPTAKKYENAADRFEKGFKGEESEEEKKKKKRFQRLSSLLTGGYGSDNAKEE